MLFRSPLENHRQEQGCRAGNHCRGNDHEDPQGSGNTLASTEFEKHREQVAAEGQESNPGNPSVAGYKCAGRDNRHNTLERVTDKGQNAKLHPQDAIHIGCADIAASLSADVPGTEEPRQNHAGGN